MKQSKWAAAALMLAVGGWLLYTRLCGWAEWQPLQAQSGEANVRAEAVETAAALENEMQTAWLASRKVNMEDYGGWPEKHAVIGTIGIPAAGIECDVIFGDTAEDLRRGACFYPGKRRIPGGGKNMLLGAHNNSHFHTLGLLQPGDTVTLKMYYGDYEYRVRETAVVREDDATVYDLAANDEVLILYTCYPFDMLSRTVYRYFVYCEPVSGSSIAG